MDSRKSVIFSSVDSPIEGRHGDRRDLFDGVDRAYNNAFIPR